MLHNGKRSFKAVPVSSAEELAHEVTRATWVLCTGFRLGDLLFLNDSFTEDSSAEYAVIQLPENTETLPNTTVIGKQIESITFGWCTEQEALENIKALPSVPYDTLKITSIQIRIHVPKGEHCPECA